jgi:hypothetical protein
MNPNTIVSVDKRTKDFALILSVKTTVVEVNGQTFTKTENTRRSYVNSKQDREQLLSNEPQDIIDDIMAEWGDTPTIQDPVRDDSIFDGLPENLKPLRLRKQTNQLTK